ncbi:hypothetical protein HK102_005779, partial [Quaeritorhiza haematococci]
MIRKPKSKSNIRQKKIIVPDNDDEPDLPSMQVHHPLELSNDDQLDNRPEDNKKANDDEEDLTYLAAAKSKISAAKKKGAAKKGSNMMSSTSSSKGQRTFNISFDDEEDVEEFKIKKSAASRRMAKAKLNKELVITPESLDTDNRYGNGSSGGADYSAEGLKALRESQLSRKPPPVPEDSGSSRKVTFAVEDECVIPDAAAIHAARKLREQKRAAAMAGEAAPSSSSSSDFISLNGTETLKPKKYESRLVDEDQEIEGEEAFEDQQGDRFAFGGTAAKDADARRKEEFRENLVEAQEEEVEDEEVRKWEAEQMKKGALAQQDQWEAEQKRKEKQAKSVRRTAPIPEPTALPTLPSLTSLLSTHLTHLTLSTNESREAMDNLTTSLSISQQKQTSLTQTVKKRAETYDWFQKMRTYVEDFAGFLDAKIPVLERVENVIDEAGSEETKRGCEKRWRVLDDWLEGFTDFRAPADSSLSPQQKHQQRTARQKAWENRHQERLRRRSDTQTTPTSNDDEISTDNSDFSDTESSLELQSNMESALDTLHTLFADASPDFTHIPRVKSRFAEWRAEHRDEFERAYVGLSLVGIWEVFLRSEMAAWKPFKEPIDLESMTWHRELVTFDLSPPEPSRGGGDEAHADQTTVLTKLVEKCVVPRVKKIVAGEGFDPFSKRGTDRAIGVLREVGGYVDVRGAAFKGLITAFELRLDQVVTTLWERYGGLHNASATTANRIKLWHELPPTGSERTHRKRALRLFLKLYKNVWVWR